MPSNRGTRHKPKWVGHAEYKGRKKWVGTHDNMEDYRNAERQCLEELRVEGDDPARRAAPTVLEFAGATIHDDDRITMTWPARPVSKATPATKIPTALHGPLSSAVGRQRIPADPTTRWRRKLARTRQATGGLSRRGHDSLPAAPLVRVSTPPSAPAQPSRASGAIVPDALDRRCQVVERHRVGVLAHPGDTHALVGAFPHLPR